MTVERGEPAESADGCPECDGDVRTVDGESVCAECGLVVDEQQIDHGVESAFRDRQRGPPRTHTRHDRGLGTAKIGYSDARGNHVYSPQLYRMRREDVRARFGSKADRLLAYGLGDVKRITTAMGQGYSVAESAGVILRRAQEEDLFRGRSIEAMAAASVAAALRLSGAPFGVGEVAGYARVDEDAVWLAYRALNQDLGLPTPPPAVASFVPRLASTLDLPDEFRAQAEALARECDEKAILQGHKPSAAAAACIYVVAVKLGGTLPGVTQTRLATVADTAPETIRNSIQAIESADDVDLDEVGRR